MTEKDNRDGASSERVLRKCYCNSKLNITSFIYQKIIKDQEILLIYTVMYTDSGMLVENIKVN